LADVNPITDLNVVTADDIRRWVLNGELYVPRGSMSFTGLMSWPPLHELLPVTRENLPQSPGQDANVEENDAVSTWSGSTLFDPSERPDRV
jgi:hypothetical protein